jgi:hypothetical protein
VSIYMRARYHVIPCDRTVPVCAGRCLSDSPRCG